MPQMDDALRRPDRQTEQINSWSIKELLAPHLATATYLIASSTSAASASSESTFHSNNELWEAFLNTQSHARTIKPRIGSRLRLESFFIFEWLPRSPGLFFTPHGRDARNDAKNRIRALPDGSIVFDPYGKMSMLEGGIGNVRLMPITVNGQEIALMSASSNGECHEGFPIAVPIELYDGIIDELKARGTVVRNLTGRLKAIPEKLSFLYESYTNVPKLYLMIEDLSEPAIRKSRTLEDLNISVAASFLSDYEGSPKVYACYVNTDPKIATSLVERVSWMEAKYVRGTYNGQVLTDFDELENHFSSAIFGLKKVMSLNIRKEDFSTLGSLLPAQGIYVNELIMQQVSVKEQKMSQYNNYGTVGAFGDNAKTEKFVQFSSSDLSVLAEEIAALKQVANTRASTEDQKAAVTALSQAEEAAKAGNAESMLQKLKAAGKWIADLAASVGKSVLADMIEHQIGLK
jgi:hypothetical protein